MKEIEVSHSRLEEIAATNSCGRIGQDRPLRGTFTWRGGIYVCMGSGYRGRQVLYAKAYRLDHRIHIYHPRTYADRRANGDEARADPLGFFHSVGVTYRGDHYALVGPPIRFAPDDSATQAELFGGET